MIVPVNVSDQTELAAIDLMVADKVTDKSATDAEVSLAFRHKLVKLEYTIDKLDVPADADLTKAEVTIEGTPAKASWSLTDAALTADAASKTAITLPAHSATADVLTGAAILVPCSTEGVTIYKGRKPHVPGAVHR